MKLDHAVIPVCKFSDILKGIFNYLPRPNYLLMLIEPLNAWNSTNYSS